VARAVVLKVKYADFTIRTRRATLEAPSADGRLLAEVARGLLERVELGSTRRLRLIGVAATNLEREDAPRQLELLGPPPRGERLGHTFDAIHDRFGRGALQRATLLEEEEE
jgi:DNA polymerase-4